MYRHLRFVTPCVVSRDFVLFGGRDDCNVHRTYRLSRTSSSFSQSLFCLTWCPQHLVITNTAAACEAYVLARRLGLKDTVKLKALLGESWGHRYVNVKSLKACVDLRGASFVATLGCCFVILLFIFFNRSMPWSESVQLLHDHVACHSILTFSPHVQIYVRKVRE